jgi:transcription antitermination factor NusG
MQTDKAQWYVLKLRPKTEKTVYNALIKAGFQAMLPLKKSYRNWGGRLRIVDEVAIASYIFVYIMESCRKDIFRAYNQSKMSFLYYNGKPCILTDTEARILFEMTAEAPPRPPIHYENIPQYSHVEILSGPFSGKRAIVQQIGKHSLCVRLVLSKEQAAEMPFLEKMAGNIILHSDTVQRIK